MTGGEGLFDAIIPSDSESNTVYEIQARLAYAGLITFSESEMMTMKELTWWFDWLIAQQKREKIKTPELPPQSAMDRMIKMKALRNDTGPSSD